MASAWSVTEEDDEAPTAEPRVSLNAAVTSASAVAAAEQGYPEPTKEETVQQVTIATGLAVDLAEQGAVLMVAQNGALILINESSGEWDEVGEI